MSKESISLILHSIIFPRTLNYKVCSVGWNIKTQECKDIGFGWLKLWTWRALFLMWNQNCVIPFAAPGYSEAQWPDANFALTCSGRCLLCSKISLHQRLNFWSTILRTLWEPCSNPLIEGSDQYTFHMIPERNIFTENTLLQKLNCKS